MVTERQRERQIAVLMYPGVTTLELVGTASALSGLRIRTGFRTVIVAEQREPMDTDTSIKLLPESTFEEVPQPFGIVVPGGGLNTIQAMGDETLLGYVRSAAQSAKLVCSVGTGSLILAAAGLLEGRQATTHWAYRRILENLGATYAGKRWVEDGKFATSGGTSGGIDMGLHLVGKHKDERSARQVQLWIEYDPQPPFGPINRPDADEDALTPPLTQHQADLERALAHRPDLLEAVERVVSPAARAGSEH
jgi:transcriptional regulator GlxA family with amidase domain